MSQKPVAIVTGASSGIGKATVHALLNEGYTVYGAARRLEMMKDIEEAGAKIAHLDLTDQASIDALAKQIIDTEGRIDVLVNNAGYGFYAAVEDVSMDDARHQFEVNVFGLAAMTNAVLPTMRAQRSGKVIHIGSSGGKLWSFLGGWYQATKFALEGFADCTRNELKPFGIDVILIQPGAIESEWADIAIEHIKQTSGNGPYKVLADAGVEWYSKSVKGMSAPATVISDTIVKAINAKKPKARYAAPGSVKIMLFLRRLLSDRAFDAMWNKMQGVPKKV